jgi:hypothetical protein
MARAVVAVRRVEEVVGGFFSEPLRLSRVLVQRSRGSVFSSATGGTKEDGRTARHLRIT